MYATALFSSCFLLKMVDLMLNYHFFRNWGRKKGSKKIFDKKRKGDLKNEIALLNYRLFFC